MEKLLRYIYFDPSSPAAFAGSRAVLREAKKVRPDIKHGDIMNFLERQTAYQLHKPARHNFPRNQMLAVGIDSHWQADLCDLQKIAKYNDGFKYILTIIDVLSKHGWAIPIKNKKPETVRDAFQHVLKTSRRKPWNLMTDRGKEFIGKPFQDFLKKSDIIHAVSNSPDVKAANAERFNRTLKTRLWKFFSHKKTFRYLNILKKLVGSINDSHNRMIGCSPNEVTVENEEEIRQRLWGPMQKPVVFKFKIGDKVRITKEKQIFGKGYLPTFTEEVFTIYERIPRHPPVYKLHDMYGVKIDGIFYDVELSRSV